MSSAKMGESITASLSTITLMAWRYFETRWDFLWIRVKLSLSCITRVHEWLAYNNCNLDRASWVVDEAAMRGITDSETNVKMARRINLSCLSQCQKIGLGTSTEAKPLEEVLGGSVDDEHTIVLSI